MKRAACLLIAFLFVSAAPVLVRCEGILDEQGALNLISKASQSYKKSLTSGTTIDIKIDGISQSGSINFHVFNSTDGQLLDKTNIGTEGYQSQWTVPYGDTFEFLLELSSGDQTDYHITLTSAGSGGGGGSDAAPIVVGVVLVLVWLVSVFLIDRTRKQPPLPPPPEQPQPPPPN